MPFVSFSDWPINNSVMLQLQAYLVSRKGHVQLYVSLHAHIESYVELPLARVFY